MALWRPNYVTAGLLSLGSRVHCLPPLGGHGVGGGPALRGKRALAFRSLILRQELIQPQHCLAG